MPEQTRFFLKKYVEILSCLLAFAEFNDIIVLEISNALGVVNQIELEVLFFRYFLKSSLLFDLIESDNFCPISEK